MLRFKFDHALFMSHGKYIFTHSLLWYAIQSYEGLLLKKQTHWYGWDLKHEYQRFQYTSSLFIADNA